MIYEPIISVDEFNTFINNYESEMADTKKRILKSAQEVVEDYLGWSILSHTSTESHLVTNGDHIVPLRCKNITGLNYVTVIGGDEITDDCCVVDDSLFCEFLNKGDRIHVEYIGGYSMTKVPQLIRSTILRIASLMYAEVGGAIGLSSRTSSDGSKTFISYSNYDKYLQPLASYRKARF